MTVARISIMRTSSDLTRTSSNKKAQVERLLDANSLYSLSVSSAQERILTSGDPAKLERLLLRLYRGSAEVHKLNWDGLKLLEESQT